MSLDMDELQGELDRQGQKGGADFLENFVRMPEKNGYIILRVLPPAKADQFATKENPNPAKPKLRVPTRIHKVAGMSLHCPRTLSGEGRSKRWLGECPICSFYSYLWKQSDTKPEGSEEQKELQRQARALKPNERFYYNVLVREIKEENNKAVNKESDGPKIWSAGTGLDSMILRGILGDSEIGEKALGDITDVTGKTGRDFKIIKTLKVGSNGDTYPEYAGSKFLDPTPLGDPEFIAKTLSAMHDLHSLRTLKPLDVLEHQLQVHNGVIAEEQKDGFDPSKFMKGSTSSANVTVTNTEKKPAGKAAAKAEPKAEHKEEAKPEADSMVEEDFMKELREASGG